MEIDQTVKLWQITWIYAAIITDKNLTVQLRCR